MSINHLVHSPDNSKCKVPCEAVYRRIKFDPIRVELRTRGRLPIPHREDDSKITHQGDSMKYNDQQYSLGMLVELIAWLLELLGNFCSLL